MITWAIAWLIAQLAKRSKEIEFPIALPCCAMVADVLIISRIATIF